MTCPECGAKPNRSHLATCRRWNAMLADLGSATDRDISIRHGIGESTVRKFRCRAGIPPFQPRRAPMKNKRPVGPGRWADVDWRLDNTALGEAMGVGRDAARKARRKWGRPPEPVKPAAAVVVARAVSAAERLDEPSVDLTRPIRDLVREYNVSKHAVGQARKRRGVDLRATPTSRARVDIPVERLGKVSDHQIAREYGITPSAVAQRRQRLGIPACEVKGSAGGFQRRRAGTRPVIAIGAQAPVGGRKVKGPNIRLRDQLREREEEPTGPVRPEMVLPSSVDTAGMSTREKAIVRAMRAGKPWGWIEETFSTSREEVMGWGA